MASPILDFSHLTPDERIELAEQLWDSLSISEQQPPGSVVDELRRRRATLEADGDLGEPWDVVLREIGERNV
jgi:putative addiction module component (TIGR02574 family)